MKDIKGCISSGKLTNSAIILDREGWFMGATLVGGGVDSSVMFYDSANDDLADKTEIAFISPDIPECDKHIHCSEGIYAEVTNGAELIAHFTI